CTLTSGNQNIPLCTQIQLHPTDSKLKGVCICDYGLTEKQTIHLDAQKLIKIPIPLDSQIKITLHLSLGSTKLEQDTHITIPYSKYGLVIDTRDTEILIKSSIMQSKKLMSTWYDCFDIPHLGI
ncbi:MAG: hypothetical protein M3P33_04120, partial [bacterium]|nr:hypothetical protein [bacterium]